MGWGWGGVWERTPTCCLEAVATAELLGRGHFAGWLIGRGCGEPAAEWGSRGTPVSQVTCGEP